EFSCFGQEQYFLGAQCSDCQPAQRIRLDETGSRLDEGNRLGTLSPFYRQSAAHESTDRIPAKLQQSAVAGHQELRLKASRASSLLPAIDCPRRFRRGGSKSERRARVSGSIWEHAILVR